MTAELWRMMVQAAEQLSTSHDTICCKHLSTSPVGVVGGDGRAQSRSARDAKKENVKDAR